jgi:putative endonuclease
MNENVETGKKGEDLAVAYLEGLNFAILHRNWRYSRYEIDIIACCDNILHFIEVKTRRSHKHGYPEESVSPKKIRNLMEAGAEFMFQYPGWIRVQYNILSITLLPGLLPDYLLIEDIYL